MPTIRSILVPSDFSTEGDVAFAHALRLALAFRCDLDLFHVEPENDQADGHWAPRVLDTLVRWERLPMGADVGDLRRIGLGVTRRMAAGAPAEEAILQEMARSHADLVVASTEGRRDYLDVLRGSTVERLAEHLAVPLLVVAADWGASDAWG